MHYIFCSVNSLSSLVELLFSHYMCCNTSRITTTSYLLSNKKPDTSLIQTKTSLLKKLQELEALVTNWQNIDAILTANRYIKAMISVKLYLLSKRCHQFKTVNIKLFFLQEKKDTVLLQLCQCLQLKK